MTRFFSRLRSASAQTRWAQTIEARTDEIDLRQVQRLDRYAEAVRLHLAYLDAITREHGHDFRAGFAEFCLQRASGGVRR